MARPSRRHGRQRTTASTILTTRRRRPGLKRRRLAPECLEDRTLLAPMSGGNAARGDWDTAANWVNAGNPSDHHVPTSADDAQINIAGITVTHATSAIDSVHSLTSQNAITLNAGSLSLGTTSTINNSFSVGSGGSL